MRKFLIVGLGNKGEKYKHTRHNIGFDILDYLAGDNKVCFQPVNFGLITKLNYRGCLFLLLKPDTYVNLSGRAVKYWLLKEKIPVDQLMIVLDDLNLPYGKIRIKAKGSDGGHNGLKNIQQELNTGQYTRMRFGIGNNYDKGKQINFVLEGWTQQEQQTITELTTKAAQAVLSFGFVGVAQTMNLFNN